MIDVKKEREAFEAWVIKVCPQVQWALNDKTEDNYQSASMSWAWSAWQAAKSQAVPDSMAIDIATSEGGQ